MINWKTLNKQYRSQRNYLAETLPNIYEQLDWSWGGNEITGHDILDTLDGLYDVVVEMIKRDDLHDDFDNCKSCSSSTGGLVVRFTLFPDKSYSINCSFELDASTKV